MRQELGDPAGRLCWQPLEYVAHVRVRVEPVELGRVDQAHDGGGAFASPQGAGEQPVLSPQRQRPFILPISGRKLRSSTAGMPCTAGDSGASTASAGQQASWYTLRSHPA